MPACDLRLLRLITVRTVHITIRIRVALARFARKSLNYYFITVEPAAAGSPCSEVGRPGGRNGGVFFGAVFFRVLGADLLFPFADLADAAGQRILLSVSDGRGPGR